MRISTLGTIAMMAASATFSANGEAASPTTERTEQGFARVRDVSSLDGVWRSRGYGWIAEIEAGRARFYDATDTLCIPKHDTGTDMASLGGAIVASADGATLRMPITDPSYLYTFDRIEALPDACRAAPDPAPLAVLDATLDLFSKHYGFFEERNIDWRALADRSRRALEQNPTQDRLLEVVGDLVSSVDDAHVSLAAEHDGRRLLIETGDGRTLRQLAAQARRENVSVEAMRERWEDLYWDRDMDEILRGDRVSWALNDRMVYGVIGGTVGYIALATMEGYTHRPGGAADDIRALDLTMERVLKRFADVEAVILDISMNDGGHDMVARALAGRFAAQRTIGYYKYAGDAQADTPQAIAVEPSGGRRFTGPVYLLTSDYSMSAAEILTMAMRALPNVTHVGQATRGTLSDELSKPLPNGWSLNLSNEVYLDVDGERWEGTGIPPQVALEVFSETDATQGHVEAVRAIVDAIRSGRPIAPTHS